MTEGTKTCLLLILIGLALMLFLVKNIDFFLKQYHIFLIFLFLSNCSAKLHFTA